MLQAHFFSATGITLVKIDVEHTVVLNVSLSCTSVRLFLDVYYFKPVNHSVRKKEAYDKVCIDT